MTNKKVKDVVIPIAIFKMKLYVWICTPEVAERKYKTTWYFEHGHVADFHDMGGKCLTTPENIDPIIWVDEGNKGNQRVSCLVHEVLHVVSYALSDRGITLSEETDEIYCYLTEYLIKEILDSLGGKQ